LQKNPTRQSPNTADGPRDVRSRKLWFHAKTAGWGFGPPTCWQGWTVLVAYVVLIATGSVALTMRPWRGIGWYIGSVSIYIGLLSVAVFFVCVAKGPRLRWRTGPRDAGNYPEGYCQQCGYDLTANRSGTCPECGAPCRTP